MPNTDEQADSGRLRRLAELLQTPGTPLLALRAFLGVTFVFAGLQKLSNPNFFRASAPGSFAEQLRGSILTSPFHHLLDFALHVPSLIAVLISLAELAVGLGTLAGCFSRVAGLGGMLLSLTFFLTVSYTDSPYYYGADIVFLFAWTPFVLSEPGRYTVDALIARRTVASGGAEDPSLGRRALLGRLSAAGVVGAVALVGGGLADVIGRKESTSAASSTTTPTLGGTGSGSTTTSTPSSIPTTTPASVGITTPSGKKIGDASTIAVGAAASFTDPFQQIPAFVVHPSAEVFRAFSAICTHAGCQVSFSKSADQFQCPCHGSIYDGATGAVIQGPAPKPLPSIEIKVASDGGIYVQD